jgi:hypothetical protein
MTAPTIPAIETCYAGYRFRSRLEARWAVFFKHAGIDFKYEPEGYVVDGVPYLPDFLIYPGTEFQTWVEIKGQFPDDAEIKKAAKLAEGTGIRTYLYFGEVEIPARGLSEHITTYDAFFAEWGSAPQWHDRHGWILNGTEARKWEAGLPPTAFRFDAGDSSGAVRQRERRRSGFWWWTECYACGRVVLKQHGLVGWCPTIPPRTGRELPPEIKPGPQMAHETDLLVAAYRAAKQARFEHGETPLAPAPRKPAPGGARRKRAES